VTYRRRLGLVQLLCLLVLVLPTLEHLLRTFRTGEHFNSWGRTYYSNLFAWELLLFVWYRAANTPDLILEGDRLSYKKSPLHRRMSFQIEEVVQLSNSGSGWRVFTASSSIFLPDDLENLDDVLALLNQSAVTTPSNRHVLDDRPYAKPKERKKRTVFRLRNDSAFFFLWSIMVVWTLVLYLESWLVNPVDPILLRLLFGGALLCETGIAIVLLAGSYVPVALERDILIFKPGIFRKRVEVLLSEIREVRRDNQGLLPICDRRSIHLPKELDNIDDLERRLTPNLDSQPIVPGPAPVASPLLQ